MKLTTRQVYIVGRNTLQNSLLSKLIQSGCAAQSSIISIVAAKQVEGDALLLVDVSGMDDEQVSTCLHACHEDGLPRTVALLQAHQDHPLQHLMMFPCLRGLFYETSTEEEFIRGINALLNGEHWLPRRWLGAYLESTRLSYTVPWASDSTALLTTKEQKVLSLLAEGLSNTAIAERMHISQHTVKTHLHNLFRKIGVNSRVNAVRWALANLGPERVS